MIGLLHLSKILLTTALYASDRLEVAAASEDQSLSYGVLQTPVVPARATPFLCELRGLILVSFGQKWSSRGSYLWLNARQRLSVQIDVLQPTGLSGPDHL